MARRKVNLPQRIPITNYIIRKPRAKDPKPRRKKILSHPSTHTVNTIIFSEAHIPFEVSTNMEKGCCPPAIVYWTDKETESLKFFFEIGEENSGPALYPVYIDLPYDVLMRLLSKDFEWIWVHKRLLIGVSSLPVKFVKEVVESVFNTQLVDFKEQSVLSSWNEFFSDISPRKKFDDANVNMQHPDLLPILRPYQSKATQWMIHRENPTLEVLDISWLPQVMTRIPTLNQNVFYNNFAECLTLSLDPIDIPRGGILADEMGLGKTVITIACILHHKREVVKSEFIQMDVQCEVNVQMETDLDDDIPLNQLFPTLERNLNADEKLQLVPVTDKKTRIKSRLKQALNSWYESKLAECQVNIPKKKRRRSHSFKCVCGQLYSNTNLIKCPDCELLQHKTCTGYEAGKKYFCPACWLKQPLVESAGTLIVAPPSIFKQWQQEIQNHAPSLNAYLYNGVREQYIQPSVLSQYDVVITTYSVLCHELDHATANDSQRRMRHEERFMRKSSPLTQIEWWRLVCDEAQMFESQGSAVNKMANMLVAINRWSVTGTPIQRSISDLFYLTEFLGLDKFNRKDIWDNNLLKPYLNGFKTPLLSVLGQIFWRSSKNDVAHELNIPPQTIRYHFLKFTPIEQHFYVEEHRTSSVKFSSGLRKFGFDPKVTLNSLDKQTLNKILTPLLNLRQACSHPLAVHGTKIASKTGTGTLTELLTYMSNKCRVECEEALRRHIAALNGLAGLHCLREHWAEAVENYRMVLRFVENYKDKIHVDSLQRIHSLTNAADVLAEHGTGIPATLRDSNLFNEAKDLEEQYLQNTQEIFKTSLSQAQKFSAEINEIESEFHTSPQTWWVQVLMDVGGNISDVIQRIEQQLDTTDLNPEEKENVKEFLACVKSVKGFEVTLSRWVNALDENHKKVRKALDTLIEIPRENLVEQAVVCHLRSVTFAKQSCRICKCEKLLQDLECELFATKHKIQKRHSKFDKVMDGAQTKGSWKPHKCEVILKAVLSVARHRSDAIYLNDGKLYMRLLDIFKKEFRQLRVVWKELSHQVQACDELAMSKIRFRFPMPGETSPKTNRLNLHLTEVNKTETLHIIQPMQVPQMEFQLIGERDLFLSEFKKKFGQLTYLKNLNADKTQMSNQHCPVCNYLLEKQWCVLLCGHSFCIDCMQKLCERKTKCVNCPLCRENTEISNVSYIDLTGHDENAEISVVGNHSTKVDAIIRSVIDLKKSDPATKILIFSTWGVVLKVLAGALDQNEISYRLLPGSDHQKLLKEFKCGPVTVLLLPISWGSKGLNLIEATHVFLVEPVMNPAEELQALGRIHRIGQTKETFVHKFLIRGTIEEKIYSAVSEAKDSWSNRTVTLKDLQELFAAPQIQN